MVFDKLFGGWYIITRMVRVLTMEDRQSQLLKLIIEHYIDTAEPVGSKFLVDEAGLQVSGATIRNEMRELEEAGYLTHPHTSAGRIPTEIGYQYYIKHIMKPVAPKKNDVREMQQIRSDEKDLVQAMKQVGKYTAGQTGAAVIIAYGPDTVYYTGISNLFSEPEFQDHAHTVSISTMFDHCEERIDRVFAAMTQPGDVQILIGEKNPLGNACSLTVLPFDDGDGLFAIMSPIRTDYARNVALAKIIHELF